MKRWFTFLRENLWLLVPGGYLSQAERRKRGRDERTKKILEASTFVKEFTRSDGRERIRIFQAPGDTFGAVLESEHGAGWIVDTLVGPGAVFDSIDAVEGEVQAAIRELGWKNAEP